VIIETYRILQTLNQQPEKHTKKEELKREQIESGQACIL